MIVGSILTVASPLPALAQNPPHLGGPWLFGLSFGGGQRTTDAPFKFSQLPAGATLPEALTVGVIDVEGGVALTGRLALLSVFERPAAIGQSPAGWGSLAAHAALREWILPRVWLEGGVGASELVYHSSAIPSVKTTWWSPAYEAAAGYEILRGRTVSLQALARYAAATFDGHHVQTASIEIGLLARR